MIADVSFVPVIVVVVQSAKHHPVDHPVRGLWSPDSIAGVSAVAVHQQLILTDLVTERERGIFSRVPQKGCTLDLLAEQTIAWRMYHTHCDKFCPVPLPRTTLNYFSIFTVSSTAKWANTLSDPQYLLGLSGWRPAEARDQIRVAA